MLTGYAPPLRLPAATCSGFELQNMCTDGGLRCGAYAWVKVPTGYSGPALFAKAKIVGYVRMGGCCDWQYHRLARWLTGGLLCRESGLIFGSDDNHIRFELIGRSVEVCAAACVCVRLRVCVCVCVCCRLTGFWWNEFHDYGAAAE